MNRREAVILGGSLAACLLAGALGYGVWAVNRGQGPGEAEFRKRVLAYAEPDWKITAIDRSELGAVTAYSYTVDDGSCKWYSSMWFAGGKPADDHFTCEVKYRDRRAELIYTPTGALKETRLKDKGDEQIDPVALAVATKRADAMMRVLIRATQ